MPCISNMLLPLLLFPGQRHLQRLHELIAYLQQVDATVDVVVLTIQ